MLVYQETWHIINHLAGDQFDLSGECSEVSFAADDRLKRDAAMVKNFTLVDDLSLVA